LLAHGIFLFQSQRWPGRRLQGDGAPSNGSSKSKKGNNGPTSPPTYAPKRCNNFDDIQSIIDEEIAAQSGGDERPINVRLDSCDGVQKKDGDSHIKIRLPENGPHNITLFCSQPCEIGAKPNAGHGGLFVVESADSFAMNNVILKGNDISDDNNNINSNRNGGLLSIEDVDYVTINCTQFYGGRAANGGAVAVVGANQVTVLNSIFFGGRADENGGALYVDARKGSGARVFLNNTSFTDCKALEKGGGMYVKTSIFTNGAECFGERCRAGSGAAIFADADDTDSEHLRCDDCDLIASDDGNVGCGSCITAQNRRYAQITSLHVTVPISGPTALESAPVCVLGDDGEVLEPLYMDWKSMTGISPVANPSTSFSRVKVAESYWCNIPFNPDCPISELLKQPSTEGEIEDVIDLLDSER